jgi:hypothetical protein
MKNKIDCIQNLFIIPFHLFLMKKNVVKHFILNILNSLHNASNSTLYHE